MSALIYNYKGVGRLRQFVFRNFPPTTLNTYETNLSLFVEFDSEENEIFTFTIQNKVIVSVSMTANQSLITPEGYDVAYEASRNEINYNFYFYNDFNNLDVSYTGSTNNATQIATLEEYELIKE